MLIIKNKLPFVIILAAFLFVLQGCTKTYENNDTVKLAYFGDATDLPLITAYQEGYFEKEGVNVELVKVSHDDFSKDINSNKVDGGTCDYTVFKSVQTGTKIELGAGLGSKSIEILEKQDSSVDNISDLSGKNVGVLSLGDGNLIAAKALLSKNGIDLDSVKLTTIDKSKAEELLNKGDLDALLIWQGDIDEINYKVLYKTELSSMNSMQGHSHHGNDYYYATFAGLSQNMATNAPQKSAAVLRAWIAGENKVFKDKEGTLKKAIDNNLINGNFDENNEIINKVMWMPSVSSAKDNIKSYINIQKNLGIIDKNTDEDEFYNRIFTELLPHWD